MGDLFNAFALGDSFESKLHILALMKGYLELAELKELLFGSGYQSSLRIFGIYSHIHLVTVMLDIGLVGLIIHFLIYLRMIYLMPTGSIVILLPLFVSGFSYFPLHGMPWISSSIVLLEFLSREIEKSE